MKNYVFIIVLITIYVLGSCTKYKDVPEYDIIENKHYDAPVKSQISFRVALLDSTATNEQIKTLIELLANSSMKVSMKKHAYPTHVFVYVYKTKASFEANSESWLAMFSKIGVDDSGKYTFQLPDDIK